MSRVAWLRGAVKSGLAGRVLIGTLVLAVTGALVAAEPDSGERTRPEWVRTLSQLRDDPVRAQQVLTGSVPAEPDWSAQRGRLPRVSALLHEWVWTAAEEEWLDDIGAVIEAAATPATNEEPDERGSAIMEAVVAAVADAAHSPAARGMPDRLRPVLGRLAAAYHSDLSSAVAQNAPDTVYAGDHLHSLTPREVILFLAEVGHHEQARTDLFEIVADYAAESFDHLWSLDGEICTRVGLMEGLGLPPVVNLVAAVDGGAKQQLHLELGERHPLIAELLAESRRMLGDWVMLSWYRQLEPGDLPEPFRGVLTGPDEELIPMEEWLGLEVRKSPQREAWRDYLDSAGAASPPRLLRVEDRFFDAFYRIEDLVLDAWVARGHR